MDTGVTHATPDLPITNGSQIGLDRAMSKLCLVQVGNE